MKKSQNMLEVTFSHGLVGDSISLAWVIYLLDLHFVYPSGKPIIPHLQRCQGLGVVYYSLTLDALYLGHPRLSLN